jgi:hypothetical protein
MRTQIDLLVVGEFVLEKAAQPAWNEPSSAVVMD